MLTLVLAESSIELVPNEIVGHPTITSSARRKKKHPRELILDQSYHHSAILHLHGPSGDRGRPDIAHFSLLLALGSPLNTDGHLQCYIHTRKDEIITVNPKARLPRNTERFTSLLEQLYSQKKVPSSGTPLLSMKRESLENLLDQVSSDLVIALTTEGSPESMEAIGSELARATKPLVLVGGFSRGHFSRKTLDLSSKQYRIDRRHLEAWTVVGRCIYDYEKTVRLKRFWETSPYVDAGVVF